MSSPGIVFIDGIACSGKSTTAHRLALAMRRAGLDAEWFYEEEDDHPLRVDIASSTVEIIDRSLDSIERFVSSARDDRIYIFESFPFQCLVGGIFERDEIGQDEIRGFIERFSRTARDLNPAMIYLYQRDLGAAIENIGRSRGQDWVQWYIKWTCKKPYVRNRRLEGFGGAMAFWSVYRSLTDDIFEMWKYPKLAIDTSGTTHEDINRSVAGLFGLPDIWKPEGEAETLRQFEGVYTDRAGEWRPRHGAEEIAIRLEDDELFIYGIWWRRSRLIPNGNNSFAVEGLCIDLEFPRNGDGGIESMQVTGRPIGAILGRTFDRRE